MAIPALIAVAVVLLAVRFGLQVATVWEQTALQGAVLTEVRNLLVSDYLRASWALQADQRSGRLQELASSFASASAGQVSTLAGFLGAVFSLLAMLATGSLPTPSGRS